MWFFSAFFITIVYYVSCSVVHDSLQPHGWKPTRLLCPWNSSGKNTAVDSHSLFRQSSRPRDQTWVYCITGKFFTIWATRETPVVWYWCSKLAINLVEAPCTPAPSGCAVCQPVKSNLFLFPNLSVLVVLLFTNTLNLYLIVHIIKWYEKRWILGTKRNVVSKTSKLNALESFGYNHS